VLAAALVLSVGLAAGLAWYWNNGPSPRPDEVLSLLRTAQAQRSSGDLRGAAAILQRAVALAPGFAESHLQLGIVYAEAREYELARGELQRVVELVPQEAVGWGQLGKLYLTTVRLEEAEQALRRAVELRPGYPPYLAMLAETYRQRGDPAAAARAIPLFEEAIRGNAGEPDTHYRLGLLLQRLGRHREAVARLETASRLSPETPDPYYARGQSERALGQQAAAEKSLATFARLRRIAQANSPQEHPGAAPVSTPGPSFGSGVSSPTPLAPKPAPRSEERLAEARRLFYNQAQPDQAIGRFEEARRLDPNHAGLAYNHGLVLSFVGRKREAEAAFRQAAALEPRNPRPLAWIGTLLLERGPSQLAAAVTALEHAVSLGPEYAYGHYQLGRAFLNQNRPEKAEPVLVRGVQLDPTYRECWYSLSQCRQRLGKRAAAAAALKQFRALDSYERARRSLATAARARPDEPGPRLRLADFLAKHGQTAQAVLTLEGLLQSFPEHPEAKQRLAALRKRKKGPR